MLSVLARGDIVRLETYFQEDGRLTSRRDWRVSDAVTGQYLGAATRYVVQSRDSSLMIISSYMNGAAAFELHSDSASRRRNPCGYECTALDS